MKRKSILFLFFLFFLFFNSITYGLNYNSPATLRKGEINLSAASYLGYDTDYKLFYSGFFLINDYGIMDRFNSIVKIGYNIDRNYIDKNRENMFYAGLEGKILIWERFGGTDKFALNIGAHYKKNIGIDLALSIGSTFFKFDNYIGFDFDFDFVDNEVFFPGYFIFGAKFAPFKNKKNSIGIEAGIPVTIAYTYKIGISYRMSL